MTRPVKVLGFPRSGTSLLQRLFDAHPQVYCPPETYVFSGCARMIREASGEGPDLGMLTGLAFAGFDEADILERVRRFGFSFLDEATARAGKQLWVEKSAFDIFDLNEIEHLLSGHCRFICVIRNPLDVIASMKELTDQMGQLVPQMRPWLMQNENYYLAWASAWRDMTEALLDFHERNGENSLFYRYEDLTSNPSEVLGKITEFAEIAPFDGVPTPSGEQIGLGDWKIFTTGGISGGSIARWRKTLPRSSARLALEIVAPLMDRLGYDIPKISAPVTRQERITQYQRAKRMSLALKDKKDG